MFLQKRTFSIDVPIHFVGVWDTVASVGLLARRLPFVRSNTAIRVFRHAVSLDERRAKFKPNTWHLRSTETDFMAADDEDKKSPSPVSAAKIISEESMKERARAKLRLRKRAMSGPRCSSPDEDEGGLLPKIVGNIRQAVKRTATGSYFGADASEQSTTTPPSQEPEADVHDAEQHTAFNAHSHNHGRCNHLHCAHRGGRHPHWLELSDSESEYEYDSDGVALHDLDSDDECGDNEEVWHKKLLEEMYTDRSQPTDVLEVWFAGCHCGKNLSFASSFVSV